MDKDQKEKARRFAENVIRGMSRAEQGNLMDALVLGSYDWMDWFEDPPPRGFATAAGEILLRLDV